MLALLALAAFEAVTPLGAAARELSATLAAGRRVLELTDRTAAVRDPSDPIPAPEWPFAVALEGVRARYPREERPALDGVSLRLEPGERVALLGPSGAGKTTVANLLLRFLDPERGRVTVAGRDVSRVPPGRHPARDLGRRPGVASVLGIDPTTTCASRTRTRAMTRSRTLSAGRGSGTGSPVSRTGSTRSSARRDASSREGNGSGSFWLARCLPALLCWCSTSRPPTWIRRPQASWCATCSPPPAIKPCC